MDPSSAGDLPSTQHIVVMGIAGSGKSTVGAELAAALGWRFVEGDVLHPPANVAKMRAGIPLDDADRAPWLAAIADAIEAEDRAGRSSVVGCSALKRAYRDRLRAAAPRVRFLHLDGDPAVIRARLERRAGHFFPADLMSSQLAALEPLAPDEDGTIVDAALDMPEQVRDGLRRLGLTDPVE